MVGDWDYEAAWREPERAQPVRLNVAPLEPQRASRYASAALMRECETVAGAVEGTRNDTLNRAGFSLAQLVAAGHIGEHDVRDALTHAARYAGLPGHEIAATLASSLGAGGQQPRVVADLPALPELATLTSPTNGVTVADTPQRKQSHGAHDREPAGAGHGDPPSIRDRLPLIDWHALWLAEDEQEWIVEPVLPARRLVALYSAPKVGKSLLMLELAVGIATGERVLGYLPDRARRVLYVDFENDPRGDIRDRLQAMGRAPDELDDLCYLSFPRLAKLDTAFGAADLMAAVAEYECEVVVIDTISRAVGGEENENDTWLNFYRFTGMALKAAGVACVRLDHTGKDAERGMRGGSAKYGDVDAVWRLAKVADETYRLDCTDNRLPIAEKTIVVRRELLPRLHHAVQAEGRRAAWDAQQDEIVRALGELDAGPDVTVRRARDLLSGTGISARNDRLAEAVKRYRLCLGVPVVEDWMSDSEGDE